MTTALTRREQDKQVGIAYLLCVVGLFTPAAGLHRFYAGRWISGLIWLATWGLCGVGSVIDLFIMPRMIEDYNEGRKVW